MSAASTVIIAPHQDDEVLGCGGLIAEKVAVGADVHLIFVSNGEGSHAHLANPKELSQRREREAIGASRVLGLDSERITFLRFPDGRLSVHRAEIAGEICNIIDRHRPEEVFTPHRAESPEDHRVVSLATSAALVGSPAVKALYEYPVWMWNEWPWNSEPGGLIVGFTEALRSRMGVRFVAQINHCVDIRNSLDKKRLALAAHASQMARQDQLEEWPILADVDDGRWVDRMLQPYEYFNRTTLP